MRWGLLRCRQSIHRRLSKEALLSEIEWMDTTESLTTIDKLSAVERLTEVEVERLDDWDLLFYPLMPLACCTT